MTSPASPPSLDGRARGYLAEVRRQLTDLPEDERGDLAADLALHLHEVASADERPLAEVLGPPAEFAAELRASAGLPPPRSAPSLPLPASPSAPPSLPPARSGLPSAPPPPAPVAGPGGRLTPAQRSVAWALAAVAALVVVLVLFGGLVVTSSGGDSGNVSEGSDQVPTTFTVPTPPGG